MDLKFKLLSTNNDVSVLPVSMHFLAHVSAWALSGVTLSIMSPMKEQQSVKTRRSPNTLLWPFSMFSRPPPTYAELRVWDAKTMSTDAVASVKLPARVPSGFHAIFVSEADLAAQQQ